jgi:hypothetical protein
VRDRVKRPGRIGSVTGRRTYVAWLRSR